MNTNQQTLVLIYSIFNLFVFIKGYYESKYKKNAYGFTRPLFFLGIFVWGDAVVFGFFWFLSSLITLLLKDWILFLLIISVFWLVRSLGETIYWFNQQFSTVNRNPIKKLSGINIFHNDSIWFIYQTAMQCITIISIIFTIYLSWLWLGNL